MNLRMRELIYAFYLTSNAKELVGMKVKYVQENSSLSFFSLDCPNICGFDPWFSVQAIILLGGPVRLFRYSI